MYRRGEMVRGWYCFTCNKNHLSTSEAAACRLRAMRGLVVVPPQPPKIEAENA